MFNTELSQNNLQFIQRGKYFSSEAQTGSEMFIMKHRQKVKCLSSLAQMESKMFFAAQTESEKFMMLVRQKVKFSYL